ncbi:MAG: sugar ABC transporter substrate-binding protein [Mesorhizobium sp.]|nr:MAG: sugar ABC transporter substrate-binding protein [Mesorhizobium sp.]
MAINRRLFFASGIALATALSVKGAMAQNAELKLGLSMPTLNTPFFTVLVNAASAEATSLGGSVVQTTNANRDASQQVTDFRNLINAGANAILAGVVDRAAIGPALDYAKSRNVPVVIVDDQPAAGEVYAVVRADNLTMGERAAEALAATLTAKTGTVLQIQGALTTTNGRDRSDGFNAKFKDLAPDIKVIEQAANWDGPMSANVVSTVLSGNQDIIGIYLATDTLYYDPVAAALKSRGRLLPVGDPAHLPIVAIDGGSGALQAIRDGYLDATISQPVTDYARYGVTLLQNAINGVAIKAGPTDHNSNVVQADSYFVDELPSPIVSKENVDDPTLWGNGK